MSVAAQAELISDDPRVEPSQGVMSDVREFIQATRDLHGLLTPGQACKILNLSTGQMSVWTRRGRISSKVILGVRMVSAGEVMALLRERNAEEIKAGRRPLGSPSLSDLASSAWEEIDPMG
jgi:hypothetical protein